MLRCPGSSAQRLHRNVDIAILAAGVQLSGGYCGAQDTTIAGPSECDGHRPMRSAMAPIIQNSAASKPARVLQIETDPRWAAVAKRDSRFDGKFVYAVKTTGAYCRPS